MRGCVRSGFLEPGDVDVWRAVDHRDRCLLLPTWGMMLPHQPLDEVGRRDAINAPLVSGVLDDDQCPGLFVPPTTGSAVTCHSPALQWRECTYDLVPQIQNAQTYVHHTFLSRYVQRKSQPLRAVGWPT